MFDIRLLFIVFYHLSSVQSCLFSDHKKPGVWFDRSHIHNYGLWRQNQRNCLIDNREIFI